MSAAVQTEKSARPAARALEALFAAEWDYRMEQNPTWASSLGDRRWNDRWPDVSLEAVEKRHAHDREVLVKLRSIPRSRLSAGPRLNYDLLEARVLKGLKICVGMSLRLPL